MAKKIGDAFVAVAPKLTPGFGSDLEKGISGPAEKAGKKGGEKFGGGFKTGFGSMITGIASGLLAFGAVDVFKGFLSEANESIKVGAQTAAVLKSTRGEAGLTADQIGNLANAISLKTGIDDEAIQSGENLLLTFTNIRNEAGKGNDIFNQTTGIMTDMSAALGQDASASAIQLGKALNDPVKGITALQRVGVSFDATQKKQIASFVKAGNIMGAQKIILKELTKEFGGSAAAVATPGDKMRTAWGNLQETVGLKLMPTLSKLFDKVTSLLPQILAVGTAAYEWAAHSTAVQTTIRTLVVVVTSLWTALKGTIGYIQSHQLLFSTIAIGVLALVAAMTAWRIITGIMEIQQAILNAELWANPIGLIILAIVGLVAAFIYLWTHSEAFRKFWIGLWNDIWGFLKMVGAWFAGPFAGFFVGAWHAIADAGLWLWHNVLDPIWQAISTGISFVMRIVTSLINLWLFLASTVWNLVWKSSIKPAIDGIAAAAQWLWKTILQPIFKLVMAIVQAAGAVFSWLWKTIIKPAFDGIGAAASWAWDHVLHPIFTKVMGVVDDVGAKFKSVFASIGGFISGAFDTAVGVVKGSINGLIDLLDSAIGFINRDVIDVANKVPGVNFPHIPTVPHLASGGRIWRAGAAIINEAGPGAELVDLPAGADVNSAGQTGAILEALMRLIDAVERIAPALGRELRTAAAGVMVAARAR